VRTCIQLLQAGTLSEGVVDRYSTAAGVLVRDPDFDRLTRSSIRSGIPISRSVRKDWTTNPVYTANDDTLSRG
jgi:hypothetical protein